MVRLAEVRNRVDEDSTSHVTLARQRNKATPVSSLFNDFDFDFALLLAPNDDYAFRVNILDFRDGALNLGEEEEYESVVERLGGVTCGGGGRRGLR